MRTYVTTSDRKLSIKCSLDGMVMDGREAMDDVLVIALDGNHHYTEEERFALNQRFEAVEKQVALLRVVTKIYG